MTKEDLTKQLAIADNSLIKSKIVDEYVREELARAFKWFLSEGKYGNNETNEPITPTWEQIFTEIGRLKAHKEFYEITSEMRLLDRGLRSMAEDISVLKENKQE